MSVVVFSAQTTRGCFNGVNVDVGVGGSDVGEGVIVEGRMVAVGRSAGFLVGRISVAVDGAMVRVCPHPLSSSIIKDSVMMVRNRVSV